MSFAPVLVRMHGKSTAYFGRGHLKFAPSADPDAPTGDEILSEDEALEPADVPPPSPSQPALLRPGVVHRLDKGTTGGKGCALIHIDAE